MAQVYLPLSSNTLRVEVDPGNVLSRWFTDLERKNLDFAAVQAANNTAFAVREEWARRMPQVFDRPTPLTLRAVLYRKATKARPQAVVFIRDEAYNGTPPARYLQAQVQGGQRGRKSFENRLDTRGILPRGMYAVPGRGVQLDPYGNVPGSTLNKVLSQLGARRDPLQNETATSRGRRRKREDKRGERRSDYFALRKDRGRLKAGVYQRIRSGFGGSLRSILIFVRRATYRPRYRIFDLAQRLYTRQFAFQFERELAKAVQTSKFRGRA